MAQCLLFSAMILALLIADTYEAVAVVNIEKYCPITNIVKQCLPSCTNDEQCLDGKCCENICHWKSCVVPNTRLLGIHLPGDSIYCNLERCEENEICRYNENLKVERCMRF